MKKSYKIFLHEMRLHSVIGVRAEERKAPQPLIVDLELAVDWPSELDDNLDKVPNYSALSRDIEALATEMRPRLLETLAETIVDLCFADERIVSVRVHIRKPQALRGAAIPAVEIFRNRNGDAA